MAPEAPPSRSLFITVGSTLFEALANAGVEDLVVQYGRAQLELPPDVKVVKDEAGGSGEAVFLAGDGGELGAKVGVRVRVMRYTDDFEGEVRRASWVISHAGEWGESFNP
jgi:UDP-N-acetylglucosamine transferase subunit ALG13